MPRDASGTYTLPEAPFQPATVAQSARVNHNFSDIAAALSDSYSVSLSQPLQADLQMNGHQILGIGGDLAPTGNVTAGGNVTASGQILSVGSNTTQYPTLTINGAAGTDRRIISATAGNVRWIVAPGDGSPENGTNSGSNFAVVRYADNGTTALGIPLSINRATGVVSVAQTLAANGGISTTTVSASGAVTAASATITNATINGITAGSLGVTGNATVTGTLSSGAAFTAPSAQINGNINATTLAVSGALNAGSATVSGNLGVNTNAFVLGTLGVTGATSVGGIFGATGNITTQASVYSTNEVHAGNRGIYYTGIDADAHAVAFAWATTQMNVYVDKTYVGHILMGALQREDGAPALDEVVAVQTSRLDALEARIAALEAAQPPRPGRSCPALSIDD